MALKTTHAADYPLWAPKQTKINLDIRLEDVREPPGRPVQPHHSRGSGTFGGLRILDCIHPHICRVCIPKHVHIDVRVCINLRAHASEVDENGEEVAPARHPVVQVRCFQMEPNDP